MLDFLQNSVSNNYSNENFNHIWRMIFEKDKNYHIIPLTSPFVRVPGKEDPVPVAFKSHFVMGSSSPICDNSYSDSIGCMECTKKNSFGGDNFPTKELCFIGYVIELVGATRTSKKTGNEFPENPVKMIAIGSGKKFVNWTYIREKFEEDEFMGTMHKFKRIDGGWLMEPANLKKLGDQIPKEAPAEIVEEYASKSLGEQIGVCLATYENVKWNHPDLIKEGIVPPAPVEMSEEEELNLPNEDEDPLEED